MAYYVDSENVFAFPATRRDVDNAGGYASQSRLLSELSLTGIVNKLIDYSGFVITDNVSSDKYDTWLNSPIDFNIMGYYFRISSIKSILDEIESVSYNSVYAEITLVAISDSTTNYFIELKGSDIAKSANETEASDDYYYDGVSFVTEESSEWKTHTPVPVAGKYGLKILERTDSSSNWYIPDSSRFRFKQQAVKIEMIDDGEI